MCLFAGASIRETALSSKNGKLRSEKDVWMDFRTGVQFPSPPPITPPQQMACLCGLLRFFFCYFSGLTLFWPWISELLNKFVNLSCSNWAVKVLSPCTSCPYTPKVSMLREWPPTAFTSPSGRVCRIDMEVCRSSYGDIWDMWCCLQ